MQKKTLLKKAFAWRPSNAAWKPLETKATADRRPINQILNEIVIEHFTPKLFDNERPTLVTSELRKKNIPPRPSLKKAKTKRDNII